MQKSETYRGQSLMEILFAMAVFLIGVVTVNYLLFDATTALRKNSDFTQAYLLAEEGIDAVRSIRDRSFSDLETGTHELVLSDFVWTLEDQSPDATEKFSRSITIADVDFNIKKITSYVEWSDGPYAVKDLTLETYLSNWRSTSGDAASLEVTTSGAMLSTTTEALMGITMENTAVTPITLVAIKVQYDNSQTLHLVHINDSEVFSVAPESGVSSGTIVDIVNYELTVGGGVYTLSPLVFNGPMSGTDFLVTFLLADGSQRDTLIEL